jgi:hypothetical protein
MGYWAAAQLQASRERLALHCLSKVNGFEVYSPRIKAPRARREVGTPWAQKATLNPKPLMPAGMIRRFADNARGLLSIADSCGSEWSRRAREAMTFLLAKEKSERPEITMVRHGLVIFEALGLDQIGSVRFNRELKRLDLPDAKWTRYRGPSGGEYAHLLEMHEQSALLGKVDIHSTQIRPPGEEQCRGYKLAQFQEAQRKYGVVAPDETEVGRARLRLVKPQSD